MIGKARIQSEFKANMEAKWPSNDDVEMELDAVAEILQQRQDSKHRVNVVLESSPSQKERERLREFENDQKNMDKESEKAQIEHRRNHLYQILCKFLMADSASHLWLFN